MNTTESCREIFIRKKAHFHYLIRLPAGRESFHPEGGWIAPEGRTKVDDLFFQQAGMAGHAQPLAILKNPGIGKASEMLIRLGRSEEHTLNSSHDQISYAVFCLKKK